MSETGDVRTQLMRDARRLNTLLWEGLRVTAIRQAKDVIRQARAARCLVPHMIGHFEIANSSDGAMMPAVGCEGAMAFISLVESPQRRTEFEPDYPQPEYERHIVGWHVPAYHLLAMEMAEMHGYNSANMQQCIADGMALCNRIGSHYVMSFHEMAANTTRAAGDLEQSLAHARLHLARRGRGPDRRWTSAKNEVTTLLVGGRFEEAIEAATRAMPLAAVRDAPQDAQLDTAGQLHMALLLSDRAGEFLPRLAEMKIDIGRLRAHMPPADETPEDHFQVQMVDALAACMKGEHSSAIATLVRWEAFLDDRQCTSRWFEARLRRIAAQRLSADSAHQAEIQSLADELARRAEAARDILTLRRLEGIFDGSSPPSPFPIYAADRRPLVMVTLPSRAAASSALAGACATGFSNPMEASPMPQAKKDNIPPDPLMEQIDRVHELREKCLNRSALRVAEDVRRSAKAQQRLIPFLGASFGLMNISQNILEPAIGRDAAMEAIALLQSPERARAFQGDYETSDYERYVHWMSACSYDNLAVAIGRMNGYNSEGMQACIADGIAVCKRTGKTRCITCFREYATEVFRAADDLAMAHHHAEANAHKPVDDPRNDRRWVGAHDEVEIALTAGEIDKALQYCRRALELAPLYHTPMHSQYRTAATLVTTLLLFGKGGEIDPQARALALDGEACISIDGENPEHDFVRAQAQALAASLGANHDAAIKQLAEWDRILFSRNVLSCWFEIRLRLIAAYKFAGREAPPALTRQLEAKAAAARDFLTLRRLKSISDAAWVPCPYPSAAPFTSGPFAGQNAAAQPGSDASSSAGEASSGSPAPFGKTNSEVGPMFETISAIGVAAQQELIAARQQSREPQLTPSVEQLFALGAGPVSHPHDAGHILFLATRISFAMSDLPAAWAWARALAGRFPDEAGVQSLRAELGNTLRTRKDSPLADVITPAELESIFRLAMEKDPNRATVFARAAGFYLGENNAAKAEQCLARASRLDRSDAWVAQRLAELYSRSDRASDALTVLDLCVREGKPDPGVLYDAAMVALSLKRNELVVTYLDTLEKMQPGAPWVPYFQAQGLLDLGRVAEASAAIEREAERARGGIFHVTCIRAAVAAAAGDKAALRDRVADVLATPLFTVENLTASGIATCLARVWSAAAALAAEDQALRTGIENRCLASSLIPAGMLNAIRRLNERGTDLHHYICILEQPLDERWQEDPARLPRQEKWKSYRVRAGVLAKSEDEARDMLLAFQGRCNPLAATIESAEAEPRKYNDFPGITWRDYPVPAT
ncbi:MAG TPA: hypothetical protein VFE47_05265 [Tepidisphaeraceae bacterium]|jgi:tetratricopeptide (TPR) repeat protein|nr:hypothetical protein [Tepidisphaeraceae bacterium]